MIRLNSLKKTVVFNHLLYQFCNQFFDIYFKFLVRLFFTVGCHPTRCNEFESDPDKYYSQLCTAIEEHRNKVVAIGECGLDYDRLHFCKADVQKKYFERQLDLVVKYKLPLFLHCRNSFDDFYDIIQRNLAKITNGGVVHSFDGTIEEAKKLIEIGFYIGLNGCSLKTEDQLKVVAQIPNERILIETDCPWCGIRPSHAGKLQLVTTTKTIRSKTHRFECHCFLFNCSRLKVHQNQVANNEKQIQMDQRHVD